MFSVNINVVSEVGGGSQYLSLPTTPISNELTQLNVATKVNINKIYSTESGDISLIGGVFNNNLEGSSSSGVKLVSSERLSVPIGAWLDVYKDSKLFYIGYIESISYTTAGNSHQTSITLSPALEALNRQGYLATQFEEAGGLVASTEKQRESVVSQQKYIRDLNSFVQLICSNSYLKFFSVISDMPKDTLYYSLFRANDSNYNVLKMFSDTFSRFLFQLKTGDVFSTQLLDKSSQFGSYDLTDYVISSSDNLNYKDVSATIYYSYLNAVAITGGAIGVVAKLNFEEFAKLIPKSTLVTIDPAYENVTASTPPIAVSISETQLLATQSIGSITTPLVSVDTRFIKNGTRNMPDVKKYSELQILQEFFTRLRRAYTHNITIPTLDDFYAIDVGSEIILNNLSHIVQSYSYDVNTNLTSLKLIPKLATSANIEIQPALQSVNPRNTIANIINNAIYGA